MGVAQLVAQLVVQANTTAHAQLRSRDHRVGGIINRGTDNIQLSMAEVSLPGDGVATYLACVTWCLVKVVVETWDWGWLCGICFLCVDAVVQAYWRRANFFSGEGGRDRGGERCVFIFAVTGMLSCLLWVRWWSNLEDLLPNMFVFLPGGVVVLHIGNLTWMCKTTAQEGIQLLYKS